MKRGLLIAACLVSATTMAFADGVSVRQSPQGQVTAIVVLEDEPVMSYVTSEARHGRKPDKKDIKARADKLKAAQDRSAALLAGQGAKEKKRFSRLVNAIAVTVPAGKLDTLRQLPGVTSVQPSIRYHRTLDTSARYIGAYTAWTSAVTRADGTGLRIGILDTGIDYTHADFGPSTNFPNAKIAGGYDFCDRDPNPMDDDGHGTHVAGIAAGRGVLLNGSTYAGPYTNGINRALFAVPPGIAPNATLYALKVLKWGYGETADIVDGMEWALDPNGDLDFSDRLDVINMSLGAAYWPSTPDHVESVAISNLVAAGCVVVASAGNSGNKFFCTGMPSSSEQTISVANSIDDGNELSAIQVVFPPVLAGLYTAVEADFSMPLAYISPVSGRVVYAIPPDATTNIQNAAQTWGNIVLIDRGVCSFEDKVGRAQDAGATAVIVVNNVDEEPFTMSGTRWDIFIPAVMVSKATGDLIKSALAGGVTARLDSALSLPAPEMADRLHDSSSRGPAPLSSRLKPDLAAPGSGILSALMGWPDEGTRLTGTSMSAPHVAGAVALIRQVHPGWTASAVKAALMNTARPLRDENGFTYPESRMGAGCIRVERAISTPLTAEADGPLSTVSLSFKVMELAAPSAGTNRITLTNHGGTPLNLGISVSNTVTQAGFTVTPVTQSLTVPASGVATALVRWAATPALFSRTPDATTPTIIAGWERQMLIEACGQIWFTSATAAVHIPWHTMPVASATYRAAMTETNVFPGSGVVTSSIACSGSSAHTAPLVSAFQLGCLSDATSTGNPAYASADIVAVGAASDAGRGGIFTNSFLYFGVATAGRWSLPLKTVISIGVEIDINRDGTADFASFNSTRGNYADGGLDWQSSADGVLLAVTRGEVTYDLSWPQYLNDFAPSERDTAPLNNSVMVLPVRIGDIGVNATNPAINYRVVTEAIVGTNTISCDSTPWVSFDSLSPAVDTAFGLDDAPFYQAAGPVSFSVDPARLATLPQHPAVLLLHHMNTPSNQVDIVRLTPPSTRYVSTTGTHSPPFTNWSGAATTIQAAVNIAFDGDTVFVTNGSYSSGGAPLGTFSRVFVNKKISLISMNGPSNTFIVGSQSAPTTKCVSLAADALLAGFTLTNGASRPGASGGGAYLVAGVLSNCIVSRCQAAYGAGVYVTSDGDGQVLDSLMSVNNATNGYGGGIYLGAGATARRCIVRRNTSLGPPGLGGGIYAEDGITNDSCSIEDCIVSNNSAISGGGLYVGVAGTVKNTLIYKNTATSSGGGARGGSLDHCTISGNTAAGSDGTFNSALRNCIIYYNGTANWSGGSQAYSCSTPLAGGVGNISNLPQFIHSSTNLHLRTNSPCIDAGTNGLAQRDLDRVPRPLDGNADGVARSDMGCFEYLNPAADSDADGLSDSGELSADTSPLDPSSCLRVSRIIPAGGSNVVEWTGGSRAWQYLERKSDLINTEELWTVVLTAQPPTSVQATFADQSFTNGTLFYRLRAVMP